MPDFHITDVCFVQFEAVAAKQHAESQVHFCPSKAVMESESCSRWGVGVWECGSEKSKFHGKIKGEDSRGRQETYVMPMQLLVPLPNDTMKRSNGIPSVVVGLLSQRSGMNSRLLGNIDSSWETSGIVMLYAPPCQPPTASPSVTTTPAFGQWWRRQVLEKGDDLRRMSWPE